LRAYARDAVDDQIQRADVENLELQVLERRLTADGVHGDSPELERALNAHVLSLMEDRKVGIDLATPVVAPGDVDAVAQNM
jgi:hypothetical protein